MADGGAVGGRIGSARTNLRFQSLLNRGLQGFLVVGAKDPLVPGNVPYLSAFWEFPEKEQGIELSIRGSVKKRRYHQRLQCF